MSLVNVPFFEATRCKHANIVTYSGKLLDPAYDLHVFTRFGFDWGDEREGSAQLALAMIWAVTLDEHLTLACADDFRYGMVAALRRDSWQMPDDDVRKWVRDWAKRNHYTSKRLPAGV